MTPTTYAIVGVVATLVLWKMNMLPTSISEMLFTYMPNFIAQFFSPIPVVVVPVSTTTAESAAAACPPKGGCESSVDEKQCGVCPSACEWFESKCRSRKVNES